MDPETVSRWNAPTISIRISTICSIEDFEDEPKMDETDKIKTVASPERYESVQFLDDKTFLLAKHLGEQD